MKFTPKREKDGGPLVNWLADQMNQLGAWLIKKSMDYAVFYEVDLTEDEPDQSESCACGRGGGCCNV